MTPADFSGSRRRLLQAGGSALLLPACSLHIGGLQLGGVRPPTFQTNPFTLGVASGAPLADGFVIWTRLAPEPLADDTGAGGMPPQPVEVEWIVANDESLAQIVGTGVTIAEPEWAHSVHVDVAGLKPDRPYWYAFRVGSWQSSIGRARTTPVPGSPLARLRFAFASCQHYEAGHYAAYRHMVADNPDLIVHLGDYIYEGSSGTPVRRHEHAEEPRDLAAYRRRHACYKLDPDLQAAHAHAPWLLTWDDHEVDNDYAGLRGAEAGVDPAAFAARRAAAYQAYWEHMPLRLRTRPVGGSLALHSARDFGDLLRLQMLDTRQYRSDQACATPDQRGGQQAPDCAERRDPGRSMLGPTQEQWLLHNLDRSPARWNVIGQPMLMAPLDQKPGAGETWWTDGWDGYPAARDRILGFIDKRRPSNPVVIGGDIHSFWATDLLAPGDRSGVPVATEFVGSSISSPAGFTQEQLSALLPENPHVKLAEARHRGYVLCDVDRAQWRTNFRFLTDVRDPASAVETLASFVVESGRAGAIFA
ncbi:MAG: alkaline phosphatase D family protein [Panacagrimonas sp.]